jgi:PPM family protein phosphatase
MALEAYGKSDPGCVRSVNQDRILIDASLGLFLVCDGMGGHEHGEVAAEAAVASIRYFLEASRDADVTWPDGFDFDQSLGANRLTTAIKIANGHVWRKSQESMSSSGMGTTIAGVLLDGASAIVAHIGDSRVYLFRDETLSQLTIDDTMVQGMVSKGLLSPENAAIHPMRNVLTQAAGAQDSVDVHVLEQSLQWGDLLLLCSDGLYGCVSTKTMESILSSGVQVEQAVNRLISEAVRAGAPDNVSAVVLRYS